MKLPLIYTFGYRDHKLNTEENSYHDGQLLSQVGGKALALMAMSEKHLPVPPGLVLSVEFFGPWLAQVKEMEEYKIVTGSPSELLRANCDELKARCRENLQLDAVRRTDLDKYMQIIGGKLFAVRSSSPEEDLAGASFAGGYETTLGVNKDMVEGAILHSFCSCFDERVFRYKETRGFRLDCSSIAVIVQVQIEAETAGVAFSLNPLNNCFDEAVVNANWGLGESVVSGISTPDSFIVDKFSRNIIESTIGPKETAIKLDKEVGTRAVAIENTDHTCISEGQVLEIVKMLDLVESYCGRPVDIEWAYENRGCNSSLYLLQARPITAYIPLPDNMITQSGNPKRLYMDTTLLKQGIQEPFSVLGMDYFDYVQQQFTATFFGKQVTCSRGASVDTSLYFNTEGRSYTNISVLLKWMGVVKVAKSFRTTDSIAASILDGINESEYAVERLPRNLRGLTVSIIIANIRNLVAIIKAYWDPEKYLTSCYEKETQNFLEGIDRLRREKPALRDLAEQSVGLFIELACRHTLPMTAAAEWARSRIFALFKDEPNAVQDRLVYLERSLDHNITIEMGLEMFRLSQMNEITETCTSSDDFVRCLQHRSFSIEFLSRWDDFTQKFGCRCPFELDIASERPSENPKRLYQQLKVMSQNRTLDTNPELIFKRARDEREDAFAFLHKHLRENRSSPLARKFEHYYKVLTTLGGFREIHKYYWVLTIFLIRCRVLEHASTLVGSGRIERVEDTFSLRLEQLEEALVEPNLDLRQLIKANMKYRNSHNIREYPLCIDSRGKIIRPPRRVGGSGELLGAPISPGIVIGRVNVLHSADEKPLLPGEILVARATDPGWTPLFVNAAGIVLEVGGLLQHGALVAREYGKPCVAGIANVLGLLKDGQLVELDGTSGVVRLLDEEANIGVKQHPKVSI
mmetsp:Transcript_16008/g.46025  ORF Transcript_16008/g.46025 Transcript_16008/m.46025 type:complete len:917 (-) Transcript_16008:21-2771(-)